MSRILVTGATGFAGGYILRELAGHFGKEALTGTGRDLAQAEKLRAEGFHILVGDLSDERFVADGLGTFDTVVHCAAKSSVWGSYESFYSANVAATKNILKNTGTAGKLIYISTPSIYFNFKHRFNVKESDPLASHFVNAYTATKYLAEQAVLQHKGGGLQKIILRPRAILGAGDPVIMPRVIRAFKENKLRIIGDGKNMADFTSAKNLALAVRLVIGSEKNLDGEVFNITDGEPMALWPLLEETLNKLGYKASLKKAPYALAFMAGLLSEKYHALLTGKEPAITRYGIGILNYSMTLNIDKAKKLLDYKPVITTRQSVQEFIRHYQH